MPGPTTKKKDPFDGYPSLSNMRRILDASNPNKDNVGAPGTVSTYGNTPTTGSYEDMKNKGLTDMSAAEFGNRSASAAFNKGSGTAPTSTSGGNYKGVLNGLAQYAPNIVNSFRKPPLPSIPKNVSPVTLRKVNLDNSRNEANRQGRIADLSAEKSGLDSNAVAAVKANTLATKLNANNQINSTEANQNAQINNQQAQINSGVDAQNTAQYNQWQNNTTEARVAQQREQSQNLANASDKYVAGQNEMAKAQLEKDKFGIGMQLFKDSGVFSRFMSAQKAEGNYDPTGIDKQFKTKNSYSTGGIMRKVFNYK